MKKILLLLIFFAKFKIMYAQDNKNGEYNIHTFSQQTNSKIHIVMYSRKKSWGMGQQFFGMKIKNLTDHKLKISGYYYANLTCGNVAKANIDIVLKPNEEKGGNSFIMDATGLTSSAESEQCQGDKIYLDGKIVGTNRIKSVGYMIDKINDITIEEEREVEKEQKKEAEERRKKEEKKKKEEENKKKEEEENKKNEQSKKDSQKSSKQNTDSSNKKTTTTYTAYDNRSQEEIDRENRVNRVRENNDNTNRSVSDAGFATLGLMALLEDKYADNFAYLKFQLGLGYEVLPIITNTAKVNVSQTAKASYCNFNTGLKLGIFNDKGISLHINPTYSLGITSFSLGSSGANQNLSVNATLLIGKYAESKLKICVEANYQKKNGDWSYDKDAALGTATDEIQIGEYQYTSIKYGGGLMFHWVNVNEETYVKPIFFLEKPSFASTSSSYGFSLEANLNSFIVIQATYSKNYLIPGQIKYKNNFTTDNQNFFSIKLIKNGFLF